MGISKDQVTGLVLAGGMGSRMGGVDKGLQVLAGTPMALHVLNKLRPQVGAVMINANRHLDDYRSFGVPVFSDAIAGYPGPLAGIHAGMIHCGTDYLASAPCDSPLLPDDLVSRLADALQSHAADAAVAVAGRGEHRRRHPVFMLVRSALKDGLAAYLNEGGRKVGGWLDAIRCVEADFSDEASFINVNSPQDLQAMAAPEIARDVRGAATPPRHPDTSGQ